MDNVEAMTKKTIYPHCNSKEIVNYSLLYSPFDFDLSVLSRGLYFGIKHVFCVTIKFK